MAPWHERDYVLLDLETSGVNRDKDRVVTATVGVMPFDGEPVITEWIADPGIEIPKEASDIHGYTTERVRTEGRPAADVIAEISNVLTAELLKDPEPRPLVIYNAPFDISMFIREERRHGIPSFLDAVTDAFGALFVICPLTIDKALNPFVKGKGMRKLEPTAARYGVELKNAHDATADATATGMVARRLVIPQDTDIDGRTGRIDDQIRQRRAILKKATVEELTVWQKAWYAQQKHGLADYFQRGGNSEAAASCRAEAPFFPYAPIID